MEGEIRSLAYSKWEQAGCPFGRDEEFWLLAENEIIQKNRSLQGFTFTKPIRLILELRADYGSQKQVLSGKSWKQVYVDFLNFIFAKYGNEVYWVFDDCVKLSSNTKDCPRMITINQFGRSVFIKTKYDANHIVKIIQKISSKLNIRTAFQLKRKAVAA